MNHEEKARDYAARIRWLLEQAHKDGLAFTITGGRRTEYKLKVTVLPHTLDLDEPADPDTNQNQGD
ncbi:MAG: hypothetical protein HOJ57_21710 [Lentisphaerae bacterium]|jgi:hypothetical protein|nr:hypothetical protein [Lentisphaerota bacterium]MBT5608568.1 hypothetical protein [Lentisphaerota bacterium]